MSSTESLTRTPFKVGRGKDSPVSGEKDAPQGPDDMQPTVTSNAAAEAAVLATPNRDMNLPQREGSQLFDVGQYDHSKQPPTLTCPASSSSLHQPVPCTSLSAPSSSSPDPQTETAQNPEPSCLGSGPLTRQSPSPTPLDQKSTSGLQPSTSVTPSAGVASQIRQAVTSSLESAPVKVGYMAFSAKVVPSARPKKSASKSLPTLADQAASCQHVGNLKTHPPKHAHSEEVLTQTIGTALAKTFSLAGSVSREQQLLFGPQRSSSATAIEHQSERFRSFDKTSHSRAASKGIVSLESTQSDVSIGPIDIGFFSSRRRFTSTYGPPQETAQSGHVPSTPGLPWATMFVIVLQFLTHWKFLYEHCPERRTTVATILREGRWERLAFAAFHHGDVVHITSNVVSFLFKGLVLETALGTTHFAHVFAIVVVLVGLVNAAIVQYLQAITSVASLEAMDLNTFAGVAVTLELLHRRRFPTVTADFMQFEIGARPAVLVLCELFVLWVSSSKNLLPIISGLLVGFLLAETSAGEVIIRSEVYAEDQLIGGRCRFDTQCRRVPTGFTLAWYSAFLGTPSARSQLHLSAIPRTPITCLFVACICATHLYGPFPQPSAAVEPTLIFGDSFRQPSIPGALYVGNVYHLAYVVLSLIAVGHNLERTLGRR
ncbi:hypothetical protein V5799_017643, partial [Amblyomma americanum]